MTQAKWSHMQRSGINFFCFSQLSSMSKVWQLQCNKNLVNSIFVTFGECILLSCLLAWYLNAYCHSEWNWSSTIHLALLVCRSHLYERSHLLFVSLRRWMSPKQMADTTVSWVIKIRWPALLMLSCNFVSHPYQLLGVQCSFNLFWHTFDVAIEYIFSTIIPFSFIVLDANTFHSSPEVHSSIQINIEVFRGHQQPNSTLEHKTCHLNWFTEWIRTVNKRRYCSRDNLWISYE